MLRVPVLPAPPPSLGPHGSDRGVRVAFVPVALPIGLSSWAARVASTVPQSLGPVPQRCHKPHGARPGERAISRDPSAAHSVSCFPTSADPSPLASCLTPGYCQNRLPCPSHGSHQAARGTPRGCPGSGSLCPNLPVQPARDPPELPSFPHSRQDPLWAAPPPPHTHTRAQPLSPPPHTPPGAPSSMAPARPGEPASRPGTSPGLGVYPGRTPPSQDWRSADICLVNSQCVRACARLSSPSVRSSPAGHLLLSSLILSGKGREGRARPPGFGSQLCVPPRSSVALGK